MEIDAHPNWLSKLPKSALNSVTLNNVRLTEGSDKVVCNPAYEQLDDEVIKGMINDFLKLSDLTPKLREIEESNSVKFGPRSIAKKWVDRKQSLLDYFQHEPFDPGKFDVNGGRLRPCGINTVAKSLLKASSAGLPYMMRKGLILNDALKNWVYLVGEYPCVLFTRTQELGKTRNVWGYPVASTIWEQLYFIPILAVERLWTHRAALLGPDAVDIAISRLLLRKTTNQVILCVDFSSYDASVSPEYTYSAFRELSSLFQKKHHADLYRLFKEFTNIGVFTPEGEWFGPHGVPSGSSFTNTIDSLVQYMVSEVSATDCQIQGDDGVYLLDESDLELVKGKFKSAGLKLNDDKSNTFEDQEAVYLQRYFHPKYTSVNGGLGGVYSAMRAFNRIKYLERWTDFSKQEISGADFFSLRTITILENCKHHPCFQEIVKMAHRLDARNLDYSSSGLRAFSKAQESKARAGVYNQYGLESGIGNFETVKILNRL
jgi:hypothetical protein